MSEFKDPIDLLKEQNTDAYQWAGSFMQTTKGEVDFDDMLGWFANAIMVERDKCANKYESLKQQADMLYEALKSIDNEFKRVLPKEYKSETLPLKICIVQALKTYEQFLKESQK